MNAVIYKIPRSVLVGSWPLLQGCPRPGRRTTDQLMQLQWPYILFETSFTCWLKQLATLNACVIIIGFLIFRPHHPVKKISLVLSPSSCCFPPFSASSPEPLKRIDNLEPSHWFLKKKHRITVFVLFIMFPQLNWHFDHHFDQQDPKDSKLRKQICSSGPPSKAADKSQMEMPEKWVGEVWRDQINSYCSIPQKFKQKITQSSGSEILPLRWWYGLSNYCDYREPERNYPVPLQECYL